MMNAYTLYALTSLLFSISLPVLWYLKELSIGKMVLLLFFLDIALTIEAAFYSDIVLIAVLHVITIPAFFALIYLDLVQQNKTKFRCFVCGQAIQESQQADTVNRLSGSDRKEVNVHSVCIGLESHERKAFSKNSFKKGIPE
jgi:hypothetical protein